MSIAQDVSQDFDPVFNDLDVKKSPRAPYDRTKAHFIVSAPNRQNDKKHFYQFCLGLEPVQIKELPGQSLFETTVMLLYSDKPLESDTENLRLWATQLTEDLPYTPRCDFTQASMSVTPLNE